MLLTVLGLVSVEAEFQWIGLSILGQGLAGRRRQEVGFEGVVPCILGQDFAGRRRQKVEFCFLDWP